MIKTKLYTAISFFGLSLSLSFSPSPQSILYPPASGLINSSIVLPNAYAHNDYWHKHPLFDALDNGFTYMEADIYLCNRQLIVGHVLPQLRMHKNLEKLYLKPLANYIFASKERQYKCRAYPITLMIDIKSDAEQTYTALEKLLKKYRFLFSSHSNGKFVSGYVTVVITGNKPYAMIKSEKDRLAFVDEDLMHSCEDSTPDVYRTASCNYWKILSWNGNGIIPASQENKLISYVNRAHRGGRKVRLWASPENKAVWKELLRCNVDLINTDELTQLRNFLIFDAKLYAQTQSALEHSPNSSAYKTGHAAFGLKE